MAGEQIGQPESLLAWATDKIAEHFLEGVLALVGAALLVVGRAWWRRRRVRRARGERFTILIAALEGDDKHQPKRKAIQEVLQDRLGSALSVTTWPEPLIVADGRGEDSVAETMKTARRWLKRTGCDMLIWGYVKSDRALGLRFATAAALRNAKSFLLTETMDLPTDFNDVVVASVMRHVTDMTIDLVEPLMFDPKALKRIRRMIEPLFSLPLAPKDRAHLHSKLGLALYRLGEPHSVTPELEDALAAFEKALALRDREAEPQAWANSQINLGLTFKELGTRRLDTADTERAIAAYREALRVWTREEAPNDWAAAQSNLGCALTDLGNKTREARHFEEAIQCFEGALDAIDKDSTSTTLTLDNMGTAFLGLGKLKDDIGLLQKAVELHSKALDRQYITFHKRRVPRTITQFNLGNALLAVGERLEGTAELKRAQSMYLGAREVFRTRELAEGLARIESLLAERQGPP